MKKVCVEISDAKYARVLKDASRIELTPEQFLQLAIDRATPTPEFEWSDRCNIQECYEHSVVQCRCELCLRVRNTMDFRSCEKHVSRVRDGHIAFMGGDPVFVRRDG